MTAKPKIDLFKIHKSAYAAPKKPVILTVAEAKYLSIGGAGEPGSDLFSETVGALYAVAYTIKMTRKAKGLQDYVICKLEGRYWADQGDLSNVPMSHWQWQLLIRTPDFVTAVERDSAIEKLRQKGKTESVRNVGFQTLNQSQCVQMLHVGSYDREYETIATMTAFAAQNGFRQHGRHHEIYLSDPRRVPAERLKTIIRLPVVKA